MKPRRLPLVLALLPLLAGGAGAATADRSKPPTATPPKAVKLPPIQRLSLSNGLPLLLVEAREVPAVEVVLLLRSGAAADPPSRSGVACMTSRLLDDGSGGRDALAIADALDLLGAELRAVCAWDATSVRLHVPVARLPAALATFADVSLRPALRAKDFERLRREALTDLLQARDEPRQLASLALARAVFGTGHRYGLPRNGDAASLQEMKLAELRAFHTKHYRPENATLIAVGAVDSAGLLPQLEKAFGSWQKGGPAGVPLADPPQVAGRQVWLVDRPGSAQSVLRVGRVGPGRATSDHPALEVMNTLLGGSFTSRLNDNLREQHGYAYGARSGFEYRIGSGLFSAGADVHTPVSAEALREVMSELTRIRTPPKKDEVERARAFLAAGFAREFETTRQIADKLAEQVLYGLSDADFAGFVPKALSVDAKAVQQAAQATIDPGNLAIVVVGDRAQVESGIAGLDLGPINVLSVEQLMGPAPKVEAPKQP